METVVYDIEKFKTDFASVADNFKKMYRHFNPDVDKSENNINSGDCGVFALAVGWVLNMKHRYTLEYIDNMNHGFIRVVGTGDAEVTSFDSANYVGLSDAMMAERWGNDRLSVMDYAGMCEAFIPYDIKGAYMIKALCALEGTEPPQQVVDLIKEGPEHELTSWIERYESYYAATIAE